jgi:chromosome segregation ATPase
VAEFAADDETLEELRSRLAEYEEIFRKAAPRLAALRKLEEVAREQRTTPAAVAAEAALILLGERTRDKEAELRRLTDEVAEILNDLQLLRNEAARLMVDRRALDDELASLRADLGALRSRRSADQPGQHRMIAVEDQEAGPPTRTVSGFELDDDDESRRFDQFFHANVDHDKARDWILG